MGPISAPVICPITIGRVHERDALYQLLYRSESGQGQLVQVCGEAGIGKSRLVAEVKARAAAEGFLVLQGACFQMDNSYPYAPLLDMLRSLASTSPPSETADPIFHEFARLLPELQLSSAHEFSTPLPDPEQEKRRLFAALSRFFKERASQQPVLLVIEDLHWCDDISLEFLLSLSRSIVALPMLLLVTYRNDEIQPGLQRFLAQLDRARLSHELQLVSLTNSDVGTMLGAMLGLSEVEQKSLLDLIYPLTEGNPFFVEEVLSALVSRGELVSDDGGWHYISHPVRRGERLPVPRSVQEAVQQRTAYLSEDAKRLLRLAAVAGRRFDFTVLQRVMHCDEEQLLLLMKELISIQFVQELSAEQFVFRHALTQQSVYTQLLSRERRLLHRMLAQVLEELYTSSPTLQEVYLEDLAYHCYEAGMWEQALVYTQEVGEKALALYAQQAAIEHFTRAVDAEHHLSTTSSPRLYLARGRAYDTLGEFESALSDYKHALEAARITQDSLMEWQSLIAIGFLWTARDYEQAGDWFRQASELAARLADPALQARSLNRLGNWLVNTGRTQEGLEAHQEALRLFETQQNKRGMAETLDLLGVAYGFYGDTACEMEAAGRACELFRELGDHQSLSSCLSSRALDSSPEKLITIYSTLRTRDEIVQDCQEAMHLARQTNSPAGQAFAEFVTTQVLFSFGEFGQALAHAQEGLRIAKAIEHQQWFSAIYGALGHIYLLLLEPAQAISALDTGLTVARTLGSSFWSGYLTVFLGQAYILRKEFSKAKAVLETTLQQDQQPCSVIERQFAFVWGELALAQGEADRALAIAEQLLESVPGNMQQPIPHLLALKGEALTALKRLNDAAKALEDAKLGAELRQAPSILWRIHRSLGQVYHLLKREDEAQQEWRSAREIIAKLADTIDDAALREHFLQAALRTLPSEKSLSSRQTLPEKYDGLTEREIEVLRAVAQGLTDTQVAERLVISPRTVHSHLNSIYSKLGISSRSAATRYAIEHDLA
ncbi:MAG TPA: AAA family ATPase [Ktedonobacteraceae bacterium]|nr:AAA family ATPase [Ktedonobacteraceae bacterium]